MSRGYSAKSYRFPRKAIKRNALRTKFRKIRCSSLTKITVDLRLNIIVLLCIILKVKNYCAWSLDKNYMCLKRLLVKDATSFAIVAFCQHLVTISVNSFVFDMSKKSDMFLLLLVADKGCGSD